MLQWLGHGFFSGLPWPARFRLLDRYAGTPCLYLSPIPGGKLLKIFSCQHRKSGAIRTIPEPPICSKLLRSDMVQLSTNGFRDFRGGRLCKSICSIQVTWLVECRYQDSMSPSQRIRSITLFCFGLRVRTSEMSRGVCQTKSNPMLQCALDVQHVQPVK